MKARRIAASCSLMLLLGLACGHNAAGQSQDQRALASVYARFLVAEEANRWDEVAPLADQMIALAQRAHKDNPKLQNTYIELGANSLLMVGVAYLRDKRYTEAIAVLRRARGNLEGLFGPRHVRVAQSLVREADCHWYLEDYAAAAPLYERALALREQLLGEEHEHTQETLRDLASTYFRLERYSDAVPLYERRIAATEKKLGASDPAVATLLHSLGNAYWNIRQHDQSLPCYQRALAIRQQKLGPTHEDTLFSAQEVATTLKRLDRQAEAVEAYERILAGREQSLGPDHDDTLETARTLAGAYHESRRYDDAARLYRRIYETHRRLLGADHAELPLDLHAIGDVAWDQEDYEEAARWYQQALDVRARTLGEDHVDTAVSGIAVGAAYEQLGRYELALPLFEAGLAARRRDLGEEHLDTAASYADLGRVYVALGRRDDAERCHKQAVLLRERLLGEQHLDTAASLTDLANIYWNQGRYVEVEPLYRRALKVYEALCAQGDSTLSVALTNMGGLYHAEGRYAEAETFYRRAIGNYQAAEGGESVDLAHGLTCLADLYEEQHRYAEAEPLYLEALELRRRLLPESHEDIGFSYDSLGRMYRAAKRYRDAETMHRRAWEVFEQAGGPEHANVAQAVTNLACVFDDEGKTDDAAPLFAQALELFERAYGPSHVNVAIAERNVGWMARYRGQFDQAEQHYLRGLDISQQVLGRQHPEVIEVLHELADLYELMSRAAQAEPLLDRAVSIADRPGVKPQRRYASYYKRAVFTWKAGRRNEALADLRRAMDLAEQQRTHSSGAEQERAQLFVQFSQSFETMVAWQVELGDLAEAFNAMERSRARSLLDELAMAGSDLGIGRSADQRQQLRQRENELQSAIAQLERQLASVAAGPPDAAPQRQRLEVQLAEARGRLYQHHRDARSTNPVYRSMLAGEAGPPRLSQVQRLIGPAALLLVYLAGEEGGYVLAVGPDAASLHELEVSAAAAQVLGVEPGPLTAERLKAILINAQQSGVVQQLSRAATAAGAIPKLAALWELLVPAEQRALLSGGKLARLFVVPDGPLTMFPLETLVVDSDEQPRYLLDVGPPVHYVPSATIYANLVQRRETAPAEIARVLTVGDPAYPALPADGVVGAATTATAEMLAARYSLAGGGLTRLPFTANESTWVGDLFEKQGARVARLLDAEATEGRLRAEAAGANLLHLACHGLTDQSYGNFFGALALTPGEQAGADPADDGFLTLAEIYELNLRNCQLAILSACETNFGPQQQGEGVWALSRGFLVAGATRVVASNWLVDDEAAASLVSYFCGGITQAGPDAAEVDYARALHAARQWVRQQPKWSNPYYWGTFVLIGPR